MTFSSIVRRLDRHWFAPASLLDLAIVRITLVGAQLFLFLPPLEKQMYYTGLSDLLFFPIPALKVLMVPFGEWGGRPDPMLVEGIWLLAVASGLTALVGAWTRFSLIAFAATNTFLIAHEYSYGEEHHPEAILIIALWTLCLAPVGSVLTLDDLVLRYRAGRRLGLDIREVPRASRDSAFARWPLRSIQWVLALSYLSAGCAKLKVGGLEWFNGHTLGFHVTRDTLLHGSALGLELASLPRPILIAASVVTVAFELGFFLAILFPASAWVFVVGGILLHTGIYLTQSAPFFQLLFVYVVFIEALRYHWPFRAIGSGVNLHSVRSRVTELERRTSSKAVVPSASGPARRESVKRRSTLSRIRRHGNARL